MKTITIKTKDGRDVIDITEEIGRVLDELGAEDGLCNLFLKHTTAALTVGELEDGNGPDFLSATEAMTPKLDYLHDNNPKHVGAHIISAFTGSSLTLPVEGGKVALGRWQRIALVELDGPRERTISIMFIKNG